MSGLSPNEDWLSDFSTLGGGFVMIATSEPFVLSINAQGYMPPFTYAWEGQGKLRLANGGN